MAGTVEPILGVLARGGKIDEGFLYFCTALLPLSAPGFCPQNGGRREDSLSISDRGEREEFGNNPDIYQRMN